MTNELPMTNDEPLQLPRNLPGSAISGSPASSRDFATNHLVIPATAGRLGFVIDSSFELRHSDLLVSLRAATPDGPLREYARGRAYLCRGPACPSGRALM